MTQIMVSLMSGDDEQDWSLVQAATLADAIDEYCRGARIETSGQLQYRLEATNRGMGLAYMDTADGRKVFAHEDSE